jgi:hypothetical protein
MLPFVITRRRSGRIMVQRRPSQAVDLAEPHVLCLARPATPDSITWEPDDILDSRLRPL